MEAMFYWMLKAGFRGSLVILAVLVLRLILGKAPKSAVCGLWLLAFLSLLLPVEIHSPLSLQPPVPVVLEQAAAESSIPEPAAPEAPAAPHDREPVQKRESPRNPLPGIWLTGAGLLGLGGLLSYIRLRRQLRRAEPADGYWVCPGIDTDRKSVV